MRVLRKRTAIVDLATRVHIVSTIAQFPRLTFWRDLLRCESIDSSGFLA